MTLQLDRPTRDARISADDLAPRPVASFPEPAESLRPLPPTAGAELDFGTLAGTWGY
jgi:hypothetical protein